MARACGVGKGANGEVSPRQRIPRFVKDPVDSVNETVVCAPFRLIGQVRLHWPLGASLSKGNSLPHYGRMARSQLAIPPVTRCAGSMKPSLSLASI